MATNETELELKRPDGHVVRVRGWLPSGTPRAVVQIAHGMAEHGARYARFAQALTATGRAVYAADHRGHGPAAQAAGTLGHFGPGGFASVVADLAAVSEHLRERHPQRPLALFAHSMGSFAAQAYLLQHERLVDAVVLSGSAAYDLRAASLGPAITLQDMNKDIVNPRTPFDWLSRDEAEVDRYVADLLCGFPVGTEARLSIRSTLEPAHKPDAFRAIRPSLPILLITGDEDPVNRNLAWFHPLVDRLKAAGLQKVQTRIYPGARHELLNEVNRDEVTRDLLDWMEAELAGS